MADHDMFHTVEIMRAASPYFDSRSRVRVELLTKMLDLMVNLKSSTGSNNMAACGFDNSKIDIEGLLNGIRPICNNRERIFIDKILNFFNMRRMFEMYNNMMATMKTMQEFGGFPFGESNDTVNVTGNFSGFNFESIFGNQKDSSYSESSDAQYNENEEASDANSETGQNNYGNSNPMNNQMFEMLKAMVPPEQLSTFENFSMLLNTMSYDNNNSKPDHNKEQSDG